MTVVKSYKELGRDPMVGDRVVIVGIKTGRRWNFEGLMDRYVSTIMTVEKVNRPGPDFSLGMREDKMDKNRLGGWSWFPEMISGVIIDEIEEDISLWTSDFSVADLLT